MRFGHLELRLECCAAWELQCASEACGRRVFDFDVYAGIPSAPTLLTESQRRSGALVSPVLDCGEEFVCATQMYGDDDLSLTSTPLVDERERHIKSRVL